MTGPDTDLARRLAEQGDQPLPLFDLTDDGDPDVIGLFEGYGGLTRAVLAVLGGRLVAYSEIEPAACRLLAHHHPDVPNLGNITEIDWATVSRRPDRPLVLAAGFPCQDVSSAGRRAGLRPGTRSGLWQHTAHAVAQLRPELVVIENVRGLLSADAHCELEPCPWCLGDDEGRPLRALGAVLGDLADLGYDAQWIGLRAADVGAPHGRFRIIIIAWPTADAAGEPRGVSDGEHEPAGRVTQRRVAASADAVGLGLGSGRARDGRSRPAHHGGAAADAERDGRAGRRARGPEAQDARGEGPRAAPTGRRAAAADASRSGRERPVDEVADQVGQRPAEVGAGATTAEHRGAVADAAGPGRAPREPARPGRPEPAEQGNGGGPVRGGSAEPGRRSGAAPDAVRDGREGRPERDGGSETGESASSWGDAARRVLEPAGVAWGDYEPAIQRWELILGRPAPAPTQTGRKGGQQLSPRFVEWLMGLPEGHVTAVPGISRNEQLKMLGNGVVPAQAETALRWLLGADAEAAA